MDSVAGFMLPVDDLRRAQRFYADAFGWDHQRGFLMTTPTDEVRVPIEPGRINGVLSPREKPDPGIQLGVEVASMDETLERITTAGGEIVAPKADLGGYGWSARFRDTEGNVLSLWEPPPGEPTPEGVPSGDERANSGGGGGSMDPVTHFEIPVDDMKRAQKFYADAFGWTNSAPPGMEGQYEMLMTTEVGETWRPTEVGRINGALYARAQAGDGVMITVEVPSIDEAIERVQAAGGEIVAPKVDMGGYGWYARFRDSEGNIVSLWEPKPMGESPA